MLLRLAYLTVTNAFAVLRLLPVGDRDVTDLGIGRGGPGGPILYGLCEAVFAEAA